MKEKILVLSSSSNKEGNSDFLAKKFIEKANPDKYDFEYVYLYDLDIDFPANENRKALIEQDLRNKDIRELIDKIELSNKIIIAAPIWNFGIPSPLKNMIDRALTSGRVWSEEKNKKVPGWKGKKIYLLFTMGAPRHLHFVNYLAMLPLYFALKYYGASPKIVYKAYNCGNGSRLVIDERDFLVDGLYKKGRKYFG